MNKPSLLDAVRVVKENEKIAYTSYADAAQKISHSIGKNLFEQLAEFERFHYQILSTLEASLEESGEFIDSRGERLLRPFSKSRLPRNRTQKVSSASLLRLWGLKKRQKILRRSG